MLCLKAHFLEQEIERSAPPSLSFDQHRSFSEDFTEPKGTAKAALKLCAESSWAIPQCNRDLHNAVGISRNQFLLVFPTGEHGVAEHSGKDLASAQKLPLLVLCARQTIIVL